MNKISNTDTVYLDNDDVYINGVNYKINVYFMNRKTITGSVEDDKIIIKIPVYFSKEQKIKYYAKLREKLIKRIIDGKFYKTLNFFNNEEIIIMGKPIKISALFDSKIKRTSINFNGNLLSLKIPIKYKDTENEYIDKIVKKFLSKWAYPILKDRIEFLNDRFFRFRINQIIIYGPKKTILGSCNYKDKKIYFNLRSLFAPSDMLDSVIIHELAHLKYPNHSKKFWNLVLSVMPDYKTRKKWLNRNIYNLGLPIKN